MIQALQVAGARPNFMKVAPLHSAMERAGGFASRLIHTGQHYDWELSAVFLRDLGLPEPDIELEVGSGSHAYQTAQVMLRLEPVLTEHRPDVVIVVGDVNSTVGAAIAAAKLDIPVAHVEAGLRSFDRTMPEEINRVLTDAISDLLFAPSEDAVENLRAEGVPEERIHMVGNVMIDTLDALIPKAESSDILRRLDLSQRGYLLATLHRPSNVDSRNSLANTVDLLLAAAESLPVILVAHPRTSSRLTDTGLSERLTDGGVSVISPLGYIDFLALASAAAGVLTDSGGIQEETTVLGVPCLTIRTTTERPITVAEGTNHLVGLDRQRLTETLGNVLNGERPGPRRPKLWDGRSAERIVEILGQRFS